MSQEIQTQDLLWSHLNDRFDNVFPIDYVAPEPSVKEKHTKEKEATGAPAIKLNSKEQLYSYGMEYDGTLHESADM